MDTIVRLAFILNIVYILVAFLKAIWDNQTKKKKVSKKNPCTHLISTAGSDSCAQPIFNRLMFLKKKKCPRESCLGFSPIENGKVLYEPIWKVVISSFLHQIPAMATALLLFLNLKGE